MDLKDISQQESVGLNQTHGANHSEAPHPVKLYLEKEDSRQSPKPDQTLPSRTISSVEPTPCSLRTAETNESPSCSGSVDIFPEQQPQEDPNVISEKPELLQRTLYEETANSGFYQDMLRQTVQELTELTSVDGFNIAKESPWTKLKYIALQLKKNALKRILNCADSNETTRYQKEIHLLLPGNDDLMPSSNVLILWEPEEQQVLQLIKKLPRQDRESRRLIIEQGHRKQTGSENSHSLETTANLSFSDDTAKSTTYELTTFERALIVCNHLHQHDKSMPLNCSINPRCIDLFEAYRDKLKIDYNSGKLKLYEFKILLITFANSTIGYFNNYLEGPIEIRSLFLGNPVPKQLTQEHENTRKTYLNHLNFFIEHELPVLGDAALLKESLIGVMLISSRLSSHVFRSLFKNFYQHIDQKAKTAEQTNWLDAAFIHYLEVSENSDFLNQVVSDMSRYPFIATFSVIMLDLLTHQSVSGRIFSASRTLAELEQIGKSQKELDSMHDLLLQMYQRAQTKTNNLGDKNTWGKKIAIYFAIMNDKEKSSKISKWLGLKNDERVFINAVALAAKQEYQAAIALLISLQRPTSKAKALLGALYEKSADDEPQQEVKEQYLSKSIQYLTAAQKTLPTIALDLVRTYQKLNLSEECRRWLTTYKKHCEMLSTKSQEQSRLLLDSAHLHIESFEMSLKDKSTDIFTSATKKDEFSKKRVAKKQNKKSRQIKSTTKIVKQTTEQKPQCSKEINAHPAFKTNIAIQPILISPNPSENLLQEFPPIPDELTEAVINEEMNTTLHDRQMITQAYTNYSASFDELFTLIDRQLGRCKNIVVKSHFIQNKAWLLRDKALDVITLGRESRSSGISINNLRARSRNSAIGLLCEHIEEFSKHWHDSLSQSWRYKPELLMNQKLAHLLIKAPLRFKIQLGAQFSTVAHVLDDIFYCYVSEGLTNKDVQEIYGSTPEVLHERAQRFYQFRNQIDPSHQSI
ncbi:hypothetical protein [Endozoicomonas ascidiicola]|uniref:hypothetical protein n=1 Tax=Endozoicomonas ascidiicola TaxID=1698521 RepID=UPI00083761E0|nr:hypothetical protein [Endozoicomonas ascidiicola]